MTKAFAEGEYEQFNAAGTDQLDSDFDRAVKLLPAALGKSKKKDS